MAKIRIYSYIGRWRLMIIMMIASVVSVHLWNIVSRLSRQTMVQNTLDHPEYHIIINDNDNDNNNNNNNRKVADVHQYQQQPRSNENSNNESALFEELNTLALRMNDENRLVMIQFLNTGYLTITKSWICNVMKFPGVIKQTLFIATDVESYNGINDFARKTQLEEEINIVLVPHDAPTVMKFGEYEYYDYMLFRTKIIVHLLTKVRVTIMIVESDAVWTDNPTATLLNTPGDIVTSNNQWPSYDYRDKKVLSVGFQLIRPTSKSQHIFSRLYSQQQTAMEEECWDINLKRKAEGNDAADLNPGDQNCENEMDLLNRIIQNTTTTAKDDEQKVNVTFLDDKRFASGLFYDDPNEYLKADKEGNIVDMPVVIQNNWISGVDRKVERAKQWGHWYLSDDVDTCIKQHKGRPGADVAGDDSIDGAFVVGEKVFARWEMENEYYEGVVIGTSLTPLPDGGKYTTVKYDDDGSSETLRNEYIKPHPCVGPYPKIPIVFVDSSSSDSTTAKNEIPKILHFIHIDKDFVANTPSIIPEYVQSNINGWKKYHPDWDVRLWTNKEVHELLWQDSHDQHEDATHGATRMTLLDLLKDVSKAPIKQSTLSWMSDILRYTLVYQFGGVYLDTDTVAIQALDLRVLLNNKDGAYKDDSLNAFTVCENPRTFPSCSNDTSFVWSSCKYAAPGMIGAVKGHPGLRAALSKSIENSQSNLCLMKENLRAGYNSDITGPIMWTDIGREYADSIVLLRSATFLPCNYEDRHRCDVHNYTSVPGVFGMHAWAHSWA